jgi:FRG domain
MALPFTLPDAPAKDLDTLLDYLRASDEPNRFLYRGQPERYSDLLFPSIFRGVLNIERRYDRSFNAHCLRSTGTYFFGNYRFDRELWLSRFSQEERARIVQTDVLRQRLLDTFGYLLGSTLAQHYGLKSEMLDASTNLDVAAFFASHTWPTWEPMSIESQDHLSPGVIYRIQRRDAGIGREMASTVTYYTAPPTFVMWSFLQEFEADVEMSTALQSLRLFFEVFKSSGERHFELLKLPRGTVAASRVGRQAAAVVLPDELQIYAEGPFYGPGPAGGFGTIGIYIDHKEIMLQSIEDIGGRNDVDCFYFRHSLNHWLSGISASDLWPNQTDPLLLIMAFLLSDQFSLFPEHRNDTTNPAWSVLDPGGTNLDFDALERFVTSSRGSYDAELHSTLDLLKDLDASTKLSLLVRKAATACQRGHASANGDLLHLSLSLCDKALEIDDQSVLLWLLKNILHDALGEKREAQLALSSAMAFTKSIEGIELVNQLLKHIYLTRWNADFPDQFWELYNSF